ncbi:hypothetical protein C0992_001058 [Termitomyces sp. T32_za158]|nr:hypothetical protein C0992_001058 [Termitomyces sp. T32_za158]
MLAMDGNNSLKRVCLPGDRQVADLRTFENSDYYLSSGYVDQFANEVKKSRAPLAPPGPELRESSNHHEGSTSVPDDDAGDPTDGGTRHAQAPCAENWKAAANNAHKRMWAIFDETGIFAAACRHGFILWLVDMIRSSELAKYPLAIIAKLLEILPPGFLMGYDIGCVFEGTIDRSSLGKLVSASNQVASVTRYMLKHRRRVFIDLFFSQWDADKYENLGNMLYNNYSQALKIINVDGPELEHAKEQLKVNEGELEVWRLEQKEYFSNLGKEPEEHVLKIAYVERLQELREAQ